MKITPHIILASQSPVRRDMLEASDLQFETHPSPYDEEKHKHLFENLHPQDQAAALASGKAQAVSALYPDAYVIGADQICAYGDKIFDKPGTTERAKAHLRTLQNTTHCQHSAACIYHHNTPIWSCIETVTLTMRALNDRDIADYVAQDMPLGACGAYRFEAHGHRLFSNVSGTAAAIKGLPLASLLAYLKSMDLR